MIIESFIKDPDRMDRLEVAANSLQSINGFALFLEIAAQRNRPGPSSHPLETSALRSAWHDGYYECLMDLFNFRSRYGVTEQQALPTARFGGAEMALNRGDLTQEEYDELTGSKSK